MKKVELNYKVYLICGILIGVLCILLPHMMPEPAYAELSETTVTAAGFHTQHHYRSSRTYSLVSTEGVEYHIRGDFTISELKDALAPGTEAQIKYYEGLYYFQSAYFIKELSVNGQVLVRYESYQKGNVIGLSLTGLLAIALSLLFWWIGAAAEKKERERKARRQEKLRKKYGDNYREPGKRGNKS